MKKIVNFIALYVFIAVLPWVNGLHNPHNLAPLRGVVVGRKII